MARQLKPFVKDEHAYARMCTDLHDLVAASEWLLSEMDKRVATPLTVDNVEDFLIDLDVRYIQHVTYHLKSLRKDVNVTLSSIAQAEGEGGKG